MRAALEHAASAGDPGIGGGGLSHRNATSSGKRVQQTRRTLLAFFEGVEDDATVSEIVAELEDMG